MPSTLNAPGIYIEELPSGVRPIVGVSTSDTAFVDWFPKGPDDRAVRVTSFEEFTREFGGLHPQSHGSYAVLQYFLNGGAVAWVARGTLAGDTASTAGLNGTDDTATVTATACSKGDWGDGLRVAVTAGATTGTLNVVVGQLAPDGTVSVRETHRNLDAADTAAVIRAVNAASTLVRLTDIAGNTTALKPGTTDTSGAPTAWVSLATGGDATVLAADGTADSASALSTAITSALPLLERIEPAVFNLLCLPSIGALGDGYDDLADVATKFCKDNFAFLVLDPPMDATTDTAVEMVTWFADASKAPTPSESGALYWPRLTIADPLARSAPRDIGPCGAVAGIFARTDASRGVWKAPAGIEASLAGADLSVSVSESDSARLNPVGVNVLRTFPVVGNVVWGARTLVGADVQASQWKYIPVRRTALHIEQSLIAGLKWVVFEPNDEPLWAQIRLNVGSFMHDLFRKGAFQGASPREAYFVRCDKNTTTQSDIDKGIVNILVGFAPLKPAEFVVIQIQQMAGQATA
jgi:phage tail sheath protein FI